MADATVPIGADGGARATAEVLRVALDSMDQGLIMIDGGGRVRIYNKRILDLLDLPEHVLAMQPLFSEVLAFQESRGEFVGLPNETRERLDARVHGKSISIYERTRPNGAVLEIRTAPLPGGGVVRTVTDVTAERRVGEALRQAKASYRLLAENSADMIVRSGLDGIRRYVSPASKRLLGYEPEELVGAATTTDVHPEDRARIMEVYQQLLDGAPEAICVYRTRRKDGTYAWLEAAYRLIRDPSSGAPVEYIASARDVSRRQAAELVAAEAMARRHESHRLLTMAEAVAHVGHWRIDVNQNSVYWSDEVYRIYGREPDFTPLLEDGLAGYHPDDRRMVSSLVQRARSEGADFEFAARIVRPCGEIRHVQCRAQVERAPDGTVMDIFGILQDVTDRERQTEELRVAKVMAETAKVDAEHASRVKGDFLASMSHEIRTPLHSIIGFTTLIRDRSGELPPEIGRYAELIESSSTALLTVLNDILDFSEVENCEIELVEQPFLPAALADNCISIIRGIAAKKQLHIDNRVDETLPRTLIGDQGRLQQILLNLLSNAVKFTKAGHVALELRHVATTAAGEKLRFSVSDTGIGIPKDKQDRLFQRFSQVDGSIKREFGGTGLGLSICRHLVELMGGEIGVTSEAGQGATFWFEVTLRRATDPEDLPAADTAGLVTAHRRGKLLLVEDYEVNQELARLSLEAAGHVVDVVSNGAAAVEAVRDGRYDLVLMDIQMPGMDGMTATQHIRRLPGPAGRTPIIAMSANVLTDQVRQFIEAGMDDHIGKPFQRTALYATIDRWLPRQTLAEEPRGREAVPLFDGGAFKDLRELMGVETLVATLARLREDVSKGLLVGAAVDAAGRDRLRKTAHSLVAAAGMLGLRAAARACADLETCDEHQISQEGQGAFERRLARARSMFQAALEEARVRLPEYEAAVG